MSYSSPCKQRRQHPAKLYIDVHCMLYFRAADYTNDYSYYPSNGTSACFAKKCSRLPAIDCFKPALWDCIKLRYFFGNVRKFRLRKRKVEFCFILAEFSYKSYGSQFLRCIPGIIIKLQGFGLLAHGNTVVFST